MAVSKATILRGCNSSAAAFHQNLSLLWRSPNPPSAAAAAAVKPISIFNQQLMKSYEDRPWDNQSKPRFDPAFSLSGGDVLRCQMAPPPSALRAPKKATEEDEEVYDEDYNGEATEDDSAEDFGDDDYGDEEFSEDDSDGDYDYKK